MAIYNNDSSYKELFYLLFTPLFRLSLAMLKNKQQAEEIASDVLFRLWLETSCGLKALSGKQGNVLPSSPMEPELESQRDKLKSH